MAKIVVLEMDDDISLCFMFALVVMQQQVAVMLLEGAAICQVVAANDI